jgi:hypothetical protein
MTKLQFRILYREFLFRVVDLELLSSGAQGDAGKILGQFAALLIFFGCLLSLGILNLGDPRVTREAMLAAAWGVEHFLIATTMLAVGLFAVMSWDSTFPDRRDVLVLGPLPVHTRTLFLAKVSASASAVGLTVLALHGLTSLSWAIATAPRGSILDWISSPVIYRSFAAYAITMIAAGGFIFGSVLCLQGVAAQFLTRRRYLRASAFLQMAAFCLLVSVYFLQPALATPRDFASPRNQQWLAWLPSYWFLGLLQQLNGSMHPALAPLARRAWVGLAVTGADTIAVYTLVYFRTLRRIVEEPDIVPGSGRAGRLPAFGDALHTAVTRFSVRTLMRSRQHRLILAFYLGLAFAITILFLKTPAARHQLAGSTLSGPLLASSIVIVIAWVVGTRMVFSMPVNLHANWIFRISPIAGASDCLSARRRALLVLAVAPAWGGTAVLLGCIWPWRPAAGHALILGLFGLALTELCLHGAQKIPFTCSYLPGRSNFHLTFWLCTGLIMTVIGRAATYEREALGNPARYAGIVGVLGIIVLLARWWNKVAAHAGGNELRFEEETTPVIMGLGLNQDGALAIEPAAGTVPPTF